MMNIINLTWMMIIINLTWMMNIKNLIDYKEFWKEIK